MIDGWRLLLADFMVFAGAIGMTLSVLGVVRIGDEYGKLHAASKGVVLGVMAILASSIFASPADVIARAVLVGAFLLLTSAVGSHALARLEHHARTEEQDD